LRLSSETEQSWYQSSYTAPSVIQARPGAAVDVIVRLTNNGDRTWDSLEQTPFELSYHLYDEQHNPITYEGERSALPAEVAPGQSVSVQAQVVAPIKAGTYFIEWDLLQENIAWFSWKGNPTALTRLKVIGVVVETPARIKMIAPPTDLRVVLPTPPRSLLWRAALEIARNHPLLGVGPDNFRWQYGPYLNLDKWNTDIHSNNLYLEWLADIGVPGFILFLIFSFVMFRNILPTSNDSDNQQLILLALIASLAAWYIHGLFDYFFEFTPTYVVFWLILGLALRVRGSTYADRV
jgi:O-antigen ligase/polysaccharide polymerase Wzy-like membrane protein/Ig-like domain-containing protein